MVMDWFLPADHERASALRRELRRHVERHAICGSDIDSAEVAISELLTNAVEHGGTKTWVRLDWSSRWPVLSVNDLGPGVEIDAVSAPDVDQANGRGLVIARAFSREFSAQIRPEGGMIATVVLDVERDMSIDTGLDRTRRTPALHD